MPFMQVIINFWICHPALLYGIALLLGFYGFFFSFWLSLFSAFFLWSPLLIGVYKKYYPLFPCSLSLFVMGFGYAYASYTYQFPALPIEGVKGKAHVEIKALKEQARPFENVWLYTCVLKDFEEGPLKQTIAKNIKCTLSLPRRDTIQRPLANQAYSVEAHLIRSSQGSYFLKVKKDAPWYPIKGSFSFAELRYRLKEKVKHYLRPSLSSTNASFLTGLLVGEFDNRDLAIGFSQFGLQHIMAISGFHFSILASFLAFFLGLFLSPSMKNASTILLLSLYCGFLGWEASIVRAWLMISLGLFSFTLEKRPNALNLLGVAILVILMTDPLLSQTLGFQFSFLITGGILLLYSPINHFLHSILTKRSLSEMVEMNGWNQHAYCILSLFRQSLALGIAVNLWALPLTLYYFQKFPLLSVVYNLFFPFLVSISMCLLLIGSGFTLLWPFVGSIIHHVNNIYTDWLLRLVSNPLASTNAYLTIESVPLWIVILYFNLLFFYALVVKGKRQDELSYF